MRHWEYIQPVCGDKTRSLNQNMKNDFEECLKTWDHWTRETSSVHISTVSKFIHFHQRREKTLKTHKIYTKAASSLTEAAGWTGPHSLWCSEARPAPYSIAGHMWELFVCGDVGSIFLTKLNLWRWWVWINVTVYLWNDVKLQSFESVFRNVSFPRCPRSQNRDVLQPRAWNRRSAVSPMFPPSLITAAFKFSSSQRLKYTPTSIRRHAEYQKHTSVLFVFRAAQ